MTIGPDSKTLKSWTDNRGRTYSLRTCDFRTKVFAQVESDSGEVIAMSDSYKTIGGATRWANRQAR